MKLALYSLITILGSSPFVFANWQGLPVWKQNQVAENSIAGQVKTIAIDEEGDRLIVKVKKADGNIEVAQVCHEGVQSARGQVHGSPKLEMLKDAMSRGTSVSLTFTSNYDRCIQDVRVQKAAKANDNGFREI